MTAPTAIVAVEAYEVLLDDASPELAAYDYHRYRVVEVRLSNGIVGYSFAGPEPGRGQELAALLVGADVTAIRGLLDDGLDRYFGAEHALWDALGKTLNVSAHRLLGGGNPILDTYLTLVWPGSPDQSDVDPEAAAADVAALAVQGHHRFKVRCWRPSVEDDAAVIRAIHRRVPHAVVMVDRTAHISGSTWSYEEALHAGRVLQKAGAAWLEEPLARDKLSDNARLTAALDIPVVGGEGYTTLIDVGRAAAARSYAVLQPDAGVIGGLRRVQEVAAIARGAGLGCIPHGQGGLRLAGWLQVAAAIGSPLQELALIPASLDPVTAWSPARGILGGVDPFRVEAGRIEVPQGPGLGLAVDPRALELSRQW